MSLEQISPAQRPRERLLSRGAPSLSIEELLAVLLRSGPQGSNVLDMARTLLGGAGSLEKLSRMSPKELLSFHGIGPAKACVLTASLELGRRLAEEKLRELETLDRPEATGEYLLRICRSLRKEVFGCVFMNHANKVLDHRILFEGTRNAAPVDAADLFREALLADASRLILFHNHPSGNPEASADDRAMTRRLAAGATLLGLDILDHLILAGPRWISLRSHCPEIFTPKIQEE